MVGDERPLTPPVFSDEKTKTSLTRPIEAKREFSQAPALHISRPPDPEMQNPTHGWNRDGAQKFNHAAKLDQEIVYQNTLAWATKINRSHPAILRFLSFAGWTPELSRYIKKHGIDYRVIEARCSFLAICLCAFFDHATTPIFDFDQDGLPSVVIGVHPEIGEMPIDLVAWPLGQPESFATHLRQADLLGASAATEPWSYVDGRPLHVHATPEAWLIAGCEGSVVLNSQWGGYWLSKCAGPFLADDIGQGRVVSDMLRPYNRHHQVLVCSKRSAA